MAKTLQLNHCLNVADKLFLKVSKLIKILKNWRLLLDLKVLFFTDLYQNPILEFYTNL